MNDWDLIFKDISMFDYEDEVIEEEEFEFPEDYEECFFDDDYGYYGIDKNADITLLSVKKYDDRRFYALHNGCTRIAAEAFSQQPKLEELYIPETVRYIPEGCFANGTGWAGDERGICRLTAADDSRRFFSDEYGFYEKNDNEIKLLLYFDNNTEKAFIPKKIDRIAERAFFGRKFTKVEFEINGYSYTFPKHSYFREELLKDFGKNNKLYDFENYDSFILRNHFNAERIRMLCERLLQPWELTKDMQQRFIDHINSSLEDALKALVKENAREELELMTQAGLFTQENIFKAIDILNETDKREMLNYLMEYRNANFEKQEFDFSI